MLASNPREPFASLVLFLLSQLKEVKKAKTQSLDLSLAGVKILSLFTNNPLHNLLRDGIIR
jgi:hypothetical protein